MGTGPFIGGILNDAYGLNTTFLTMSGITLIAFLGTVFFLTDTATASPTRLHVPAADYRRNPVKTIMQPDVAVIHHETQFETIIATLADITVSGLPVVDETGRVIGVVSEKDIFNRLSDKSDTSFWQVLSGCLHSNRCLMQAITALSAKSIITSPAITVGVDSSVREALELCGKHSINRLPVVRRRGETCGDSDTKRHPPGSSGFWRKIDALFSENERFCNQPSPGERS